MSSADHILFVLASSILSGELAKNSLLPFEDELSARFGVPGFVVRDALQRLCDLGLARMTHGRAKILQPTYRGTQTHKRPQGHSGDLRLLRVMTEVNAVSMLPILVLAEQRITPSELSLLEAFTDALPEPLGLQNRVDFGLLFWSRIARATKNPILEAQVIHRGLVMREIVSDCPQDSRLDSGSYFAATHRGLVRALRARTVSTFWLSVIDATAAKLGGGPTA